MRSRAAYYAAIDLPDEQRLGPPGAPLELEELERVFDRPLPPSFRTFLELHDGWVMANGAVDLLPLAQLRAIAAGALDGPGTHARLDSDDEVVTRSLIIGAGAGSAAMLLLDPERVTDAGEWAVVGYDLGEEWVTSSFVEWLEESDRSFHELAEETAADPPDA
jgi:hypothetical protein